VIKRIWHGWTAPEQADRYERLLREEILPDIASTDPEGYLGFQLLRRDAGDEVEFVTILSFDSMDGVRTFAGDDPEAAYVPPEAREVLARFDERVRHYELRDDRRYAAG
jgi:antibiotic biosynthesis monooxygenase (ABM) superfamily enzyme